MKADTQQPSRKNSSARTKADTPLNLPFWDDFTSAYRGMYPDTVLWQNNRTVWVNSGMAIKPPTINVATFDGLDSSGLAYSPNDILLKGFTDSLVSKPINLSGTGPNPVLPGEQGTVFLSFYYQWQGNGEPPDEKEDYLLVEFKNDQGNWEPMLTIPASETLKSDEFYSAMIQVTGVQFFYDRFQFRIRSFGRQSGPYDTWNLDYFFLNKARNSNEISFPDQAIASEIGSFFGKYRAMPLSHFLASKTFTTPTFDVMNLMDPFGKNDTSTVNYTEEIEVINLIKGSSPITHTEIYTELPLVGQSGILFSKERRTVNTLKLPSESSFEANADTAIFNLRISLNTEQNTTDYDPVKYAPVNFAPNDTLEVTYMLGSSYAYDDGSAEYAASLIETGNLLAYQFELPPGIKQDTLVAFEIYLPPYGVSSNQTVDFYIFPHDSVAGTPKSPGDAFRIPSRVVSNKGIDVFQRIAFLPALLITDNKFYIGWKEPPAGKMLIGLDASNDTGDKMFVSTNGIWSQNDRVHGSLMIRPVFGSGEVDEQVGIEEETKFSIYPNPSRGSFYIDGNLDHLDILSITGQSVPFSKEDDGDQRLLVHVKQPAGLYLLRCTKGTITKTHKLVITE